MVVIVHHSGSNMICFRQHIPIRNFSSAVLDSKLFRYLRTVVNVLEERNDPTDSDGRLLHVSALLICFYSRLAIHELFMLPVLLLSVKADTEAVTGLAL